MVLFRHALPICTIGCIFVAIEGHVLLAVNVEDFRNLANQFLTKNLAKKLSHLVSDTAKGNRRDDSKGDLVPDIDLNKVAELIRDKIMKDYNTNVPSTKTTRNPHIKRFNTVQNTVDTTESARLTKRILRDPNYEAPELEYVKDDVETQFQTYVEQPNKYDTLKPDYFETTRRESDEKLISQGPSNTERSLYVKENTEHKGGTHKRMDYTETKLGEWLYNHIMAQKPTKLKNHKTGNMDIHDEGNTDELPAESENIKQLQYVYSLSGQNKSIQNIKNVLELQPNKDTNNFNLQDQQRDGTSNDYIMGPKLNTIYKKKIQKQLIDENYPGFQTKNREIENQVMDKRDYVKPVQGNENTLNGKSVALHQGQHTGEQSTIDESIMRPKQNAIYKNKPQNQQIEENYSGPQNKHPVFENQIMGTRDYVKPIQENKKTFNQDNIEYDQGQKAGEQGTINESIMIPKQHTIYKKKPYKEQIEGTYTSSQAKDKEIENLHLEDRPEYVKPIRENKNTLSNENTDLGQGEGRMPANIEEKKPESIKEKIESSLYDADEGRPQPIEKHIMYDKYVLGSKEKENNQKELQRQSVRENYDVGQGTINRNSNRVDPQEVDNSDETFMSQIQKVFIGNKYEADHSPHDQLLLRNKKMDFDIKNSKNQQHRPDREVKSDSIISKKESSLDDTVEVRDRKEEKHIISTNEYYMHRKKPQKQSLEENSKHETYPLNSETKYKKHKNDKTLSDDDYVPQKPPSSKQKYDQVSDKDDEYSNKKHTLFQNAKLSSVTVAKHELTTKAPIKKETFAKDLLLGLESGKLGSSSDEIKDKQVKEHETSNKYNLEKQKESFKKQPLEENDIFDTKFNKYKHKEASDNQEMEENDMYDTKSNKDKHKEASTNQEMEENGIYDMKSKKYKHNEASTNQEMEGNDMYDTKSNKYKHKEASRIQEMKENDMYDTKSNKYKHKKASKNQEMEENGIYDTKSKKYKYNEAFINKEMVENDMYDTKSNKYKHKEASENQEMEENGIYDMKSEKHKYNEASTNQEIEGNDMYDTKSNKYKHKEASKIQEMKENDMYDTKSNKYKHKEASENQEMEENDMYDTKSNKYKPKEVSEKQEMAVNNMYDTKSNKYKHKETSIKQEMEENETDEKYSLDRKSRDKTKFNKHPIEENGIYKIYSLGSKDKNKNRGLDKYDDNYGYEDTVLGRGKRKESQSVSDRNKDESDNNDELILKNKNRHLLKATKKVKGLNHEEVPSEGYADDPRPDYREVKPEHIKAKTDRLLGSSERKGRPTKRFRMKGTLIPKREFYKLSSPNYYKDLPRTVEKYDFGEPLPERDRERDKIRYLKREPARVNRKLKLPKYEKIT